ncbi:MAG: MFS transporter [Fusicatenibacter sp.]|nr:MFS transporter [Fusicatenibacter sp.]
MSIFAGALSDRWNKKIIMLVCDTLAACSTAAVFLLLKENLLAPVHLYLLNAVNGFMNTVQQPASDVAMTLIIPKKYYQKTSGLRSFSQSLVTILHPVFAASLFALFGIEGVIYTDLTTFALAFFTLLLFISIPKPETGDEKQKESLTSSISGGLSYLKENPMILMLILFLAGVNLIASAFDAVLPAYVLPRRNGGEAILGIVTSCAGIATLSGSLIAFLAPVPKNRIRIIYITMLISLSTENFLLAFSRNPIFWCIGQIVGWLLVPLMNTNLDVILRTTIPVEMQGRVYSCRNTLQFFTIPIGFYLGGWMVDEVCEPFMAQGSAGGYLAILFGTGKGSGAALMLFFSV